MHGGRQESAARKQHVMSDLAFPLLTEQCQTRTHIFHFTLGVDEVIFAEAQTSLGRVFEHEIFVILMIMFMGCDLDLRTLHFLDQSVWFRYLDLDLHLERLLFHRAAERDQFRKHGLFTLDQEGIYLLCH